MVSTTPDATAPASSANGIAWDLGDLYPAVDSPALGLDLDAALGRARAFEAAYRGRIELGPDARLLLTALIELEGLSEQMDRPAVYAGLLHAAKTDDPRHGALLMQTRERRTAIGSRDFGRRRAGVQAA